MYSLPNLVDRQQCTIVYILIITFANKNFWNDCFGSKCSNKCSPFWALSEFVKVVNVRLYEFYWYWNILIYIKKYSKNINTKI